MSTITGTMSKEDSVRLFIKHNPLLSMYIIMFTIAWSSLLSDNSPRPFYFTVALFWMLALALILTTKGKLGYSTDGSERSN